MMKKKILALMILMFVSFAILSACAKGSDPNALKQPDKEEINNPSEGQSGKEEQEDLTGKDDLSPVPNQKNETKQVVLYFADKDLMNTYRIKKEVSIKKGDQVAKAALEAWINGPEHKELTGLIRSDVIVEYVEEVDGIANVSFSKEIQENNLGSSGELMFAEQIAMIMQQFGFDRTQILVKGRVGEALLGHLYTGDPIVAKDPESYKWVHEKASREFVLQNTAFRIYEPTPNTEVKDRIVIRGLARVYEGTILYEFEDGHYMLDEGFTTATAGAPEWGEFEIIIKLDKVANNSGRVILFEESAKDGSRINELQIPVKVTK